MRKFRVYIATCWVDKAAALAAQDQLEAAGFEVTSHWIKYHSEAQLGEPKDLDELQTQAIEDLADIDKADAFIILNLGKSEGKATELGYAYSKQMPIYLVGPRTTNIFYYLPGIVQCDTLGEAVAHLIILQEDLYAR